MDNTDTKRARLLDLAKGGNGHAAPWIERVTLRRPGEKDKDVYAAHLPRAGKEGRDLVCCDCEGGLEICQSILLLWERPSNDEAPEELEARRATLPQPEDCGRVIDDLRKLDKIS